MPFTASKTATWTMAELRTIVVGVVLAAFAAAYSLAVQSVISSACAGAARHTNSDATRTDRERLICNSFVARPGAAIARAIVWGAKAHPSTRRLVRSVRR